ncbi:MAG: hypothetical protein ACTSXW_00430 [Candidatus Baldrarchaeia archaeon]
MNIVAELTERLIKLIDTLELRLSVEYILEELDMVLYFSRALLGLNHKVTKEAEEWYNLLWGRYSENLEANISEEDAKKLAMKAKVWFNIVKRTL